ncbi:MAG: peroxiredoxin [Legionellaceae bacterium]|nr:peroxiredoxin [Legionellaceae bacterium]
MQVGDKLPSIPFKATGDLNTHFSRYEGHWLIIYFYPKDATPGCTTEGCDFRDNEKEFSLYNTAILGVSRDSITSHEKFKQKYQFPFELISDVDETICQAFDVIKMKSMYGKQVRGIERSTFIVDPSGTIRHIFRKVRAKGHVEEVLSTLKSLLQ